MNSVILSAKYQIVIPKELRKKLSIKPGQTMYLDSNKNGEIIVKTVSQVTKVYGSMKGAWGSDSSEYMTHSRDEWDESCA